MQREPAKPHSRHAGCAGGEDSASFQRQRTENTNVCEAEDEEAGQLQMPSARDWKLADRRQERVSAPRMPSSGKAPISQENGRTCFVWKGSGGAPPQNKGTNQETEARTQEIGASSQESLSSEEERGQDPSWAQPAQSREVAAGEAGDERVADTRSQITPGKTVSPRT